MSHLTLLNSEIRQLDGLHSLNDLHQASGFQTKHRPSRFLRSKQAIGLMDELSRCPDMDITLKSQRTGSDRGSYACKELVYAYAMWISPAFNLQVIRAFDQNLIEQSHTQPHPDATLFDQVPYNHRRWLVSVDGEGKERVLDIPADQMIFALHELPHILRDPNTTVTDKLLTEIIRACSERLDYHGDVRSERALIESRRNQFPVRGGVV